MSNLARLFDPVACDRDQHVLSPFTGTFTVIVPVVGLFTEGSDDVYCNDRKAIRVGDGGKHALCPGPNSFQAISGASKTFINDRPAVRSDDKTLHCMLSEGKVVVGSHNTLVE